MPLKPGDTLGVCSSPPTLGGVPLLVDVTPMHKHASQDHAHTFEEPHGQVTQGRLVLDLTGSGYWGCGFIAIFCWHQNELHSNHDLLVSCRQCQALDSLYQPHARNVEFRLHVPLLAQPLPESPCLFFALSTWTQSGANSHQRRQHLSQNGYGCFKKLRAIC